MRRLKENVESSRLFQSTSAAQLDVEQYYKTGSAVLRSALVPGNEVTVEDISYAFQALEMAAQLFKEKGDSDRQQVVLEECERAKQELKGHGLVLRSHP